MSSGSLSDAEDELWGKTRSQEKTDKKGKRPKGGADTPEVEGPPNGENQQQHEEEIQRELEDEISDTEDDPKERARESKDTQKEDVLNIAGTALRGRTVSGVKKKTAKAVSQSFSAQVTKSKSTDPKKKLKGPDSVKPNQPKELAVSQKDRNDPKVIKTDTTDPEEKQTGFESVKSTPTTTTTTTTQAQASPVPPNRPTAVEQPKKTPYMWYLAAGVVFLAVVLPFAHFLHVFTKLTEDSGMADDESYSGNATTIELLSDPHANFQERMNALKKRFPSQDESLWSSLSDVFAPNATTNPCSMFSLTSSEPFASSPTARPTLTELASALPWIMARHHFTLHHRQFTVMKDEDQAREAIKDIMRAWSTDVIVIPDVDSMPSHVMDVVQTTCQSIGAGQVVVMTSEGKPEIADPVGIAVRPERTESLLEHITLENPEEGLYAISRRFPSQTERVWQVVRAAILSHIAETDPVKPAVVIIGAPPGANRTADRLAQALARIYAEKSITIDSRQFAHVNAARAKLHLDRALESGLVGSDRLDSGILGSARAVVLTRLEALPGDAAMLFHGYCDHSDAQYKSAAYFFTVHCSEEIDRTLHYKQQERMVHQQLQRAWRNLPATHLDPLLGRITPLTTVVTPEAEMELPNY